MRMMMVKVNTMMMVMMMIMMMMISMMLMLTMMMMMVILMVMMVMMVMISPVAGAHRVKKESATELRPRGSGPDVKLTHSGIGRGVELRRFQAVISPARVLSAGLFAGIRA